MEQQQDKDKITRYQNIAFAVLVALLAVSILITFALG
ncbi:hypothetical protein Ga0123462_0323 [Mariprofundus ferrinatatus]|uniref:Uncharacterized protein n=1 Tax=Mariprofundus ferrinatatus TaxID=1921087 RepID=A0A2K8L1L7_9PROT|nr:hypothetical protein Ga0123462_0323 [Mariprofundus ferrinatatus]